MRKTYTTCDACGKDLQCDEATGFGDDYYYDPTTGERHCVECNFKTPEGFIKQLKGLIETMTSISEIRKNLQNLLDQAKELELQQAKDQMREPGIDKISSTQDADSDKWRNLYQLETSDLKSRIRELENQIIEFGKTPVESSVDFASMDIKADDLKKEIDNRDREIIALKTRNQDLQARLNEQDGTIQNLNHRTDKLQKKLEQIDEDNYFKQIQTLNKKIKDLTDNNDQMLIIIKEQRIEIGKLQARINNSQQNP